MPTAPDESSPQQMNLDDLRELRAREGSQPTTTTHSDSDLFHEGAIVTAAAIVYYGFMVVRGIFRRWIHAPR